MCYVYFYTKLSSFYMSLIIIDQYISIFLCVHVCMHVYAYICVCMCVHVCMSVYACVCVTGVCACVCACSAGVGMHVCACVHVCVHFLQVVHMLVCGIVTFRIKIK